MVRGAVLYAAHPRQSGDGTKRCRVCTPAADGAQALSLHDPDRGAGAGVRPVAVAGLRHQRWLAARQTGAGGGADRLPSRLRQPVAQIRAETQCAHSCLVPLVQ